MVDVSSIRAAAARVGPHVRRTPVERAPDLGPEVFLKLECQQRTGSFKLRGAVNALAMLDDEARAAGVVAASTGNHGLAVACAAQQLRCVARVYVPAGAAPSKVAGIHALGAEVRVHGSDPVEAEMAARADAAERGARYVSPYNDPDVIAGQGTVAVELQQQLGSVDAVIASLGGGGLIGGIGTWVRAWCPDAMVIAVSPARAPVMHRSLETGGIVRLPTLPTLSDGTAGGLEPGAITLPLCRRVVDRTVLVEEDEIAAGIRWAIERHHVLVEGAAGVAIAGCRRLADELRGRRVAVVLCGANIGLDTLRTVLC